MDAVAVGTKFLLHQYREGLGGKKKEKANWWVKSEKKEREREREKTREEEKKGKDIRLHSLAAELVEFAGIEAVVMGLRVGVGHCGRVDVGWEEEEEK